MTTEEQGKHALKMSAAYFSQANINLGETMLLFGFDIDKYGSDELKVIFKTFSRTMLVEGEKLVKQLEKDLDL